MDNLMSFTNSGLKDWIFQRLSSILVFIYYIFIISLIIYLPFCNNMFETWTNIFSKKIVKVFTIISYFSLMIHIWIGLWTIITDYINILIIRLILMILVILNILLGLIWLIIILL